ncbi:hemerythrin domain-containing protein [Azospirillum halopraeferens]|uniref:hemerythrin domain-containing protein n=1 Tax=Azospirillum halopraeferens TaxID=34010 RepID=UPI0004172035|nr:hemerythrin domain-containing protein [Azospirillum halopraeferens]
MHATTETGRRIHEDHDRTIAMLNRLEEHLRDAETFGIPTLGPDTPARSLVADLDALLDRELGPHFDFEERAVFPLLAERGAHELVQHLTDEHEAMRPVGRRLQRYCALALSEGFDEESFGAFLHFAEDLVERLERHLQVEETALLMAVETMLADAPDLDRALAAGYGG